VDRFLTPLYIFSIPIISIFYNVSDNQNNHNDLYEKIAKFLSRRVIFL